MRIPAGPRHNLETGSIIKPAFPWITGCSPHHSVASVQGQAASSASLGFAMKNRGEDLRQVPVLPPSSAQYGHVAQVGWSAVMACLLPRSSSVREHDAFVATGHVVPRVALDATPHQPAQGQEQDQPHAEQEGPVVLERWLFHGLPSSLMLRMWDPWYKVAAP